MKMKQLLFFCNLAASLLLLPPLALATKGGKKDSTTTVTLEKRLVLSPQAHLQLSTEPIWGDSVEAIVTVAVPDSCKNQRYLCRIETNISLRLLTIPRYKWAVSADSLKVLSAIPLQLRIAQQSFAASAAPVIKIHFQNVDHAAGLTGTATLEIISGLQPISPKASLTDSSFVAKPVADSSQILPAAVDIDSVTTATDSNSFGIFYVALAILLISLFAGLGWLMTWSQRHRFQNLTAKTTAAAFPHLQHLEPTPAPEPPDSIPAVAEEVTNENAIAISAVPEAATASSNLPAVIAAEQQFDLTMVLAQLQELKLNLQQIIANQQEVNHRLAQITAAAALEAPRASAQLALFDILNEDSTVRNGENYANGNGSSARRFPTAEDCNPTNLPGEIMSALPHGAENSSRLASPSSLRIFFANAESKAETSEEILLH